MSLIEKIDKKIKWCEEMNKKAITIEFKNIKKGLEMARGIILSEQKEPCELCNWFKGMKAKKPEYDCHKHLYICPHCGEYIVTYNQEFPYDMKCGGRLEW